MSATQTGAPTYADYVRCIPPNNQYKLNKKVDFEHGSVELHLHEIAKNMRNWDSDIAPQLRLTPNEISDIQEINRRPQMQRVACLQKWKSKAGYNASYDVLLKLFINTGNFECANTIVTLLGGTPADGPGDHPQSGYQPPPSQHSYPESGPPACPQSGNYPPYHLTPTNLPQPSYPQGAYHPLQQAPYHSLPQQQGYPWGQPTSQPPQQTAPSNIGQSLSQATPSQQAASGRQGQEIEQCVQEDGFESYPQQPKEGVSNVKLTFDTVTPLSGERVVDLTCEYRMDKWPHGIAVIINNEKFKDRLDRKGTKFDEYNLVQTLSYLGYVVDVYNDCTAQGIREIIDKYSTKNHTKYDSFICCILSHGTMGHVYGTDNYMVPVEEIADRINAENCPTLATKPKIFFMQCCQGTMADMGARVRSDDDDETPENPSQILTPNSPRVASDSDIVIPRSGDFYFSYATASCHKAWRDEDNGSWYVSELCKALASYAKYKSLDQMMNKVYEKVSKHGITKKEAPEVQRRVGKDIFFF